ncbi:hypothetical protein ABVN23_10380 [Pseudomonas fluorescens]|uniref:hypothetical protein n=1 Tax=Pseudomonas fluorescens TaxID=294 RepID=UPI003F96D5A6
MNEITSPEERSAGIGKKNGDGGTTLKVRHDARQSGFTVIDFGFLELWLGPNHVPYIQALKSYARSYCAATPTYSARKVLRFWFELSHREGWSPPSKSMPPSELAVQLSALRRKYYEANTNKGRALTSTTNNWASFKRLLDHLIDEGAISKIDTSVGYLAVPSADQVLAHRSTLLDDSRIVMNAPKSLNKEADSYNEDLLESISIVLCDEEYLVDYTQRLKLALSTIRSCASNDFNALVNKHEEGKKLVNDTDKSFLDVIKLREKKKRFIDPSNGEHYLLKNSKHPNLLGNILCVVDVDMGGMPKPHRKFGGSDGRKVQTASPYPYWIYVQAYGKNQILPYLGIMTSAAAVACILLLMIEYPKLNATSIYRARVEDEDGRPYLLSTAGEQGEEIRLTVAKPRAGQEKSVRLNDYCENLIGKVMEWTKPVRQELTRQGRKEEASRLWVGMSSLNYDLVAFSENTLVGALRSNAKFRSHGNKATSVRVFPFVERHPEIKPWASKLTFKSIRVNSGVLRYLETDGDLVATARAFGHNNVGTTIGHYIPPALRQVIYERQIRRHQNFLIVSSLDCEQAKLRASDFTTIEELHEFLRGLTSTLHNADCTDRSVTQKDFELSTSSGKLILVDDPHALAVAMLYRDSLENASQKFLNAPDKRTGVAPKFWVEFIDAIQLELPMAMGDYSSLAKAAYAIKDSLVGKISLPEIG